MSEEALRPEDAPPSIYGPDGEPQFFQDPAMDRFVSVILNLASEVWVQTERVETLSRVLEKHGLLTPALAAEAALDGQRDQQLSLFINRVLAPLREPR